MDNSQSRTTIPKLLAGRLMQLRGRLRSVTVAGGLGLTVAVLCLGVFVALLADMLIDLPVWIRVGLLCATGLAAVVCGVASILLPMFRRVDDTELAAIVEVTHPEFEERLISTLEFANDEDAGGSPLMQSWLRAQTVHVARSVDFADVRRRPPGDPAVLVGSWSDHRALSAVALRE